MNRIFLKRERITGYGILNGLKYGLFGVFTKSGTELVVFFNGIIKT